jgi:hypothetical protein
MCGWALKRFGKSSVNFCSDMTVGSGAGESRKLLRMDSSEGGMMNVDVVVQTMQICRVCYFFLETLSRTEVDNILHVNKEYGKRMNRRMEINSLL